MSCSGINYVYRINCRACLKIAAIMGTAQNGMNTIKIISNYAN